MALDVIYRNIPRDFAFGLGLLWTLIVLLSLSWNVRDEYHAAEQQALKVARSHLDKDLALRRWVSQRGGLYAQVSEHIVPSPYLAHLPYRDLKSEVGELTLLSPAYLQRLLMEDYSAAYGIKGRVVGLKALRLENLADDWEAKALRLLDADRSLSLFSEIVPAGDEAHLRAMLPMLVQPDCLPCHQQQGYQVGDLRGGVNVSLPLREYYAAAWRDSAKMAASHGLFWVLGLLGIGHAGRRGAEFARRQQRTLEELTAAESRLRELNEDLEWRVKERTLDLNRARKEAENANQAKSDFLYRMSHELRTPLNAIIGFSQLMLLDGGARQSQDDLDNIREIEKGGRHLLELINEILDLAKVEAGRVVLVSRPLDLEPLLSETLSLIQGTDQARRMTQRLENRLTGTGWVLADEGRLRQVALNLLSNAVKYNREAGQVILTLEEGEAGRIRFSVSDQGQGMDEDELRQLFKPFARLERHHSLEGSGIGLVLSRRLVECMGGSMGVESTPGVGSCFWVELPRTEEHDETTERVSELNLNA